MTSRETAYRLSLVAALSVILLYARRPDAFIHPDFWAEDGKVFWRGWIDHGLGSLFQPYAGYLVLAQRTIAAIAGIFPDRFAVDLYLIGTVLFTGWASVTIALCIPGVPGIVAAIAPLLVHQPLETLATATNVQWPLACAMAVIAVSSFGARRAIQINKAAFLFISALTGPFSIFAAPVFAIRAGLAWRMQKLPDVMISVGVLLCAAVQVSLLTTGSPGATGTSEPAPLAMAYHIVLHSAGGLIGLFAVAIAIASLFFGQFRLQRAGIGFIAVAVIATTMIKFMHQPGTFSSGAVGNRYWYIPSAAILIAMAFLLLEPARKLRWAGAIGILAFMVGFLYQPFIAPARQHFGTWKAAIDSGATEYKFPPGWVVSLSH